MIATIITGTLGTLATAVLATCSPAPVVQTSTQYPKCPTSVTMSDFDSTPGCDLTPPQTLNVTVEHPAPWTPIQTDRFFIECGQAGGDITDATGDAWVCQGIDY